MLQGVVKKALKFLDNTNYINENHDITTDIKKKLKDKDPKAAELKQSADDSSAVGSLAGVRKWWEYLKAKGPDFGYYQNLQRPSS